MSTRLYRYTYTIIKETADSYSLYSVTYLIYLSLAILFQFLTGAKGIFHEIQKVSSSHSG
jgi:hypothetical protein